MEKVRKKTLEEIWTGFQSRQYIRFHVGQALPNCLIDAVHAYPPGGDKRTGKIVRLLSRKIDCSGIVATISRNQADLNRPLTLSNREPLIEYRQTVKQIVYAQDLVGKPFLHLAVHGMRDRGSDIALGTRDGRLCQPDVCEWLVAQLKKEFTVGVDGMFPGTHTLEHLRHGDRSVGFTGFGDSYNVFQLEFSHSLRFEKFDRIIVVLSQLMQDFGKSFT